jgi:hypothetical protein
VERSTLAWVDFQRLVYGHVASERSRDVLAGNRTNRLELRYPNKLDARIGDLCNAQVDISSEAALPRSG